MNIWSILFGAVAAMGMGMLWYSPLLFGNLWMKLSGMTLDKMEAAKTRGMGRTYFAAFAVTLVLSAGIHYFIDATGAFTISEVLLVAFVLWGAFIATTLLSGVLWEAKPLALYLINAGHYFVVFLVITLINFLFLYFFV